MFNRDNWKEIFETIQKNKLRTFLSGFTVALGILIFVVLYGFGNGLKNTFNEFFGNDATNVLYLSPGRTTEPYLGYKANRRIEFDNSDLKDIKENFAMFLIELFKFKMSKYEKILKKYLIIFILRKNLFLSILK